MMNWLQNYSVSPLINPWLGVGIFVLVAWSLVWKGFALWRAARREETAWFVAMLIINTAGILEILYLFVFGREKK